MEEVWKPQQSILSSSVIQTNIREDLGEAKCIGGVDISFSKGNEQSAAAAHVIYSLKDSKLVYQDVEIIELEVPYIPGYLAFREAGPLVQLIQKQLNFSSCQIRPDVIFADGNGVLHPQRCGLACHISLASNIPCVGIAKNLYILEDDDILNDNHHKGQIRGLMERGHYFDLRSIRTQETLGTALKTANEASKPVYISVGHKIDLNTARDLVLKCSQFRVPEPIRLADILSCEFLRKRTTEELN